jgi:membrane fusion protein (multidrug efflux system)
VQAGQALMSVVPLDDVWVVANMKETEVRGIRPGAAADIDVDAFPDVSFKGTVDSLAPATGARFSLLPPDNATGNFTKVVQRVPVKILVKQSGDPARLLRPGMSVYVTITTP